MDEKTRVPPHGGTPSTRALRRHYVVYVLIVIAALMWWYDFSFTITVTTKLPEPEEEFSDLSWPNIEPSSKLQFTPCYPGFQCARLQVPLDWNVADAESGHTANIAIIKRPALVDVTDPRYAGPILINPGGPGGSGVFYVQRIGEQLQTIVDNRLPPPDESEKYFDIIGFDPRGVRHTTPGAPDIDDPGYLHSLEQRRTAYGTSVDEPQSYNKIFDLYRLYGRLVSSPENGDLGNGTHVAQFLNTPVVARDMLEIAERHGEWRAETAQKLLQSKDNSCGKQADCRASTLQRTAYNYGLEKLQYWGYSYGTILGQTFATLYPEHVGRLVIDGVVNATDWYSGAWATSFHSTERLAHNFTSACAEAGPERCPMARWLGDDNKEPCTDPYCGAAIFGYLQANLQALKNETVTALYDHAQVPIIVTHSDATLALFGLFYNGWIGYDIAGRMLYELSQGNPQFFYSINEPPPRCDNKTDATKMKWRDSHAAMVHIQCSDSGGALDGETKEQMWKRIEAWAKQTPTFYGEASVLSLPCTGYTARPKWNFTGPVGGKTATEKLANPILFVSQTLDPITPLVSAEGAWKSWKGKSGLVEAQGVGHCSLGWPNVCAFNEIRKYFATGEVKPNERVRCPPSVRPFVTEKEVEERIKGMEAGMERETLDAAVKIGQWWPKLRRGDY